MTVPVVTTVAAVRQAVADARKRGQSIGFVPTMGALHAGHASLIQIARNRGGFGVVSIFVNPTQFGPTEDLAKYPRTLDRDREVCDKAGADLIFAPTPEVIYPPGYSTFVEVGGVSAGLCGVSRPGHFRGVATVVLNLFNIVGPDFAVFGQKDAQQVAVIQRMVQDLNVPVEVVVAPTMRESDGLAMSSRNAYLSAADRARAVVVPNTLKEVERRIRGGERNVPQLEAMMGDMLTAVGARVDYARIVDADSLTAVEIIDRRVLIAIAALVGTTRLIDNVIVEG